MPDRKRAAQFMPFNDLRATRMPQTASRKVGCLPQDTRCA